MTDDYDPGLDGMKSYYAAIEAKRLRGDTHDWEDLPKTKGATPMTEHAENSTDLTPSEPLIRAMQANGHSEAKAATLTSDIDKVIASLHRRIKMLEAFKATL